VEQKDLTVRPIVGREELNLFSRLPYVFNEELADDLAAGRRRPGWMWVALRGDHLLARLAWWGRTGDDTPFLLDIFDIDDGGADRDRVDIGGSWQHSHGERLPARRIRQLRTHDQHDLALTQARRTVKTCGLACHALLVHGRVGVVVAAPEEHSRLGVAPERGSPSVRFILGHHSGLRNQPPVCLDGRGPEVGPADLRQNVREGFLRHRRAEAVGLCRELGGDDLVAGEDAMSRRG